jgi:hypothetical protein
MAAGPTIDDVLSLIAGSEERTAQSVVGHPSPTGLANLVRKQFGDAAVAAVQQLLSQGAATQPWRAIGAAIYLAQSPVEGTNEAVAQFAATTPNDGIRTAALDALVSYAGAAAAPALRGALAQAGPQAPNAQAAIEAALSELGEAPA